MGVFIYRDVVHICICSSCITWCRTEPVRPVDSHRDGYM